MRVKTYEAADMKQALSLVRQDLGPKAVIVSSRPLRRDRGLFGMLGRRIVEVTAALPSASTEDPPQLRGPLLPDLTPLEDGTGPGSYRQLWAIHQAVDPLIDEVRSIRETLGLLDDRIGNDPEDLRSDVAQIRTMLASLVGSGAIAPDARGAGAQRLYYFLTGRGVDEPLARSLVQRVVARVDSGSLGDLDRLKLTLAAEMRSDLVRAEPGAAPGRVQLFVGPTGVGKTTTIAKLAARAVRSSPAGALVITTDVHRVAAAEQLARFGEILDVPVASAISPEDLRRAIAAADDVERIFVDTSGRSHRDPATIRELGALAEVAGDVEVMLVMSATTRAADSREILEAYGELGWSRLVVTKLDETRVFGELYNCVARSGRPIACVTTGQSVPENLESLDTAGILRKVLHG